MCLMMVGVWAKCANKMHKDNQIHPIPKSFVRLMCNVAQRTAACTNHEHELNTHTQPDIFINTITTTLIVLHIIFGSFLFTFVYDNICVAFIVLPQFCCLVIVFLDKTLSKYAHKVSRNQQWKAHFLEIFIFGFLFSLFRLWWMYSTVSLSFRIL